MRERTDVSDSDRTTIGRRAIHIRFVNVIIDFNFHDVVPAKKPEKTPEVQHE